MFFVPLTQASPSYPVITSILSCSFVFALIPHTTLEQTCFPVPFNVYCISGLCKTDNFPVPFYFTVINDAIFRPKKRQEDELFPHFRFKESKGGRNNIISCVETGT